jgi:eukaryotic-like serine/threonine-protein kinase
MPSATKPSETRAVEWNGPPASFDQFVIERVLGSGGMGHVYLARDTGLDRQVALKFISSADPSPAARGRFMVEARAIAKLTHPNVVGVYRVGEVSNHPYIAYEFVPGESLDRIAKPIPWETTLRLASGLAAGLEAAHREGILHRDIKPSNVVLSERGEIKLLDFGLAKLAGGEDDATDDAGEPPSGDGSTQRARPFHGATTRAPTAQNRALTRPGTIMGTPAYLAPELWWADPASPRSDVWALGLVLYELLVGKLPHAHLEGEAMAFAIIDSDITPVHLARPDVPQSFATIIDRCLRREAAERYPSAIELAKALEEVRSVFLPASGGVAAVQFEPGRLEVAASLARLSSRMRPLTSRLYERLFTAQPSVRALFPEDLAAQQDKLAHALKLAIDGLADPERLAPVLEDLGRRHVRYGVGPEHFGHLEKALLGSLAELEGDAWVPSLERGWKRAFAFIEAAMVRGMDAERKTAVSGAALRRLREKEAPPELPRTRYATSGELSVAYQVLGDGPVDIVVLLGWLSHVEIAWQHPTLDAFLRGLARFARVIIFDKRGTGMSDRAFDSSSLGDRVDDLSAVFDAAVADSAVVLGIGQGAVTAAMFASMHPKRVQGLVLYGASACIFPGHSPPHGTTEGAVDEAIAKIRAHWGDALFLERTAPSMANDAAFRSWYALFMRMSASPGTAIAMLKLDAQLDLRGVLPLVRVPTLALHRTGDRAVPVAAGRDLAAAIAGARFVELPGIDHMPFLGDTASLLGEIERFAAELPSVPAATAPLVAVMSVLCAGPRPFPEDFARTCLELVARFGGTLAMNGSPLAFTFDGAVRTMRCARELLELAAAASVPLQVGLDAGPCTLSEMATCDRVHSATDIGRQAPTGTAYVSELIRALSLGSGLSLEKVAGTAVYELRPR